MVPAGGICGPVGTCSSSYTFLWEYHIYYAKHWDRNAWANSVDPAQTLHNAAYLQVYHFSDTFPGSNMDWLKFLDSYVVMSRSFSIWRVIMEQPDWTFFHRAFKPRTNNWFKLYDKYDKELRCANILDEYSKSLW